MLGQGLYDLYDEREKRGIDDIYILRIEQLYPFPTKALITELSRFKQAEMVWCQEEPRNMGAWFFVDIFLQWILNQISAKHRTVRYAGVRLRLQRRLARCRSISRNSSNSSMRHWDNIFLFGSTGERYRAAGCGGREVRQVMVDIRVPTLGESVTEATVGKWFKRAGDAVAVDEPLVELETDKVTLELPAPLQASSPILP